MSAAGSGSPGQELVARLRESSIEPGELARFLDDLAHQERVGCIRALGRPEQSRLYEVVEGFAPVQLVDLVPPSRADFQEVRHYGKNTLPLFSSFEKRFCRGGGSDPDDPGELYGYNFQTLSPLTGPGYFVAVEDEKRHEVLVDYRRLPDRHPETWPEIKPNDRGLSRFIYGFMVDTLRRVSEHVTIGSAARNGRDLGSWFVLCREV